MAQIFISYSHSDEVFIDQLVQLLRYGRRSDIVWYDDRIIGGVDWWQMILDEIARCDLFMYLISNESLASEYCRKELHEALRLGKAVLPVKVRRTPDYPGEIDPDLATELKRRQYVDMSGGFADAVTIARLFGAINHLLDNMLGQPAEPADAQPAPEPIVTEPPPQPVTPNDGAFQLDSAEAYNKWGDALFKASRSEEALVAFDQAIKLNPDFANAYYNRGTALNELGKYNEALIALDQAIKLEPDHTHAHNNRGNALKDLGKYEEALAAYDQAIKLNHDYPHAYHGRGVSLHQLGKYEEALASYDQAIALDSAFANAYWGRGHSNERLGNTQAAVADYQKYIELAGQETAPDWMLTYIEENQ